MQFTQVAIALGMLASTVLAMPSPPMGPNVQDPAHPCVAACTKSIFKKSFDGCNAGDKDCFCYKPDFGNAVRDCAFQACKSDDGKRAVLLWGRQACIDIVRGNAKILGVTSPPDASTQSTRRHPLPILLRPIILVEVQDVAVLRTFNRLCHARQSYLCPSIRNSHLSFRTIAMSSVKRKAEDLAAEDSKKPKANSSITSFFGQPKTSVSTKTQPPASSPPSSSPAAPPDSSTNASPSSSLTVPDAPTVPLAVRRFDKQAWLDKLSAEQKELLQLEINTLHDSWLPYLASEIASDEFLKLKKFLKQEVESGKKVFPPSQDVYSWSRHTPLNSVRAVVVGQDPYHGPNQAHGLCFSVRPPTPAPPSLKNIYKAIQRDYPSFSPPPKNGGLLTPWADSGLLLLNTCLTVRAHEAFSHQNRGWERFTQKVLETVAQERKKGVVFLAWGSPAQKRIASCKGLGNNAGGGRHLILKSVHPSPLSAQKGWFDCGHFKKTNEWLKQRYGAEGEIDWNLNVDPGKVDL